MKWTAKPNNPTAGQTIVLTKFLLFPLKIGTDTRWLERTAVEYRYEVSGKNSFGCSVYRWRPVQFVRSAPSPAPLALDVSLEKARALHRVWRALNDGDCPKCHKYHPATAMLRGETFIQCPSCGFDIEQEEIQAIEQMFAPAMDAAVSIFEQWKAERRKQS